MTRNEVDYTLLLQELGFEETEYSLIYPADGHKKKPVKLNDLIGKADVLNLSDNDLLNSELEISLQKSADCDSHGGQKRDTSNPKPKFKNRIEVNLKVAKEKYGGFKRPGRPPINPKGHKTVTDRSEKSNHKNAVKKRGSGDQEFNIDSIFAANSIRNSEKPIRNSEKPIRNSEKPIRHSEKPRPK
jgi:hypothetical protein